ncbi:hypothetical protein IAR50_004673 [Cryptococcus sp. DSM 104548]
MEDLSSLSTSLRGILAAPSQDQESLGTLLREYLESDSINTQRAVCEVILEVLHEGDAQTQKQRRTLLLEDHALEYTTPILQVTHSSPEVVMPLIQLIAIYGKPREVLMAFSEALQYVVDRAEGFEVSDGEEAEEEAEEEENNVNYDELWVEWQMLIMGLTIAIPRLPNTRSTPTLLSLQDLLSSSIFSLGAHATSLWPRTAILILCRLIDTLWRWVQTTTDKNGEQASILSNILFEALAILGPKADAQLTERWFLKTFPKYGQGPQVSKVSQDPTMDRETPQGWQQAAMVFNQAMRLVETLNPNKPLSDRVFFSSSRSTYGTFAAFNLLASTIPDGGVKRLLPDPLPPSTLEDAMPVLCAALSRTSVDAGIVWLWYIVNEAANGKKGAVKVGFEEVTMLLELLVPLTAQHTSPTVRLALFKLVGTLVSLLEGRDKVIALRQLLEPENPFESVRVECLSILRQETLNSPDILDADFLAQLSPILFPAPAVNDKTCLFSLQPDDLLRNTFYASWWTEVAQYVWFLSTRDKENTTGIRSVHKDVASRWLGDTRGQLKKVEEYVKWLDEAAIAEMTGGQGADFLLAKWSDAVERATSALEST